MDKCKHFDICGLNTYKGEYCFLHSDHVPKDKETFLKIFEDHRKNRGDNFKYFYFPSDIDFSSATFTGVNFQGAKFFGGVSFDNATFTGAADFQEIVFQEKANFHEATFTEEANFKGAKFHDHASFDSAKFSKDAIFYEATFDGISEFSFAKFDKEANFNLSKFIGKAHFGGNTTFTENASFQGVEFNEEAIFNGATFSKRAFFLLARFGKITSFDRVTFQEDVIFHHATFSEGAIFFFVTFGKEASFNFAIFIGEASFAKTIFSRAADFGSTTFNKGGNFSGVLFKEGKSNFSFGKFFDRSLFIGSKDDKEKNIQIFKNIKVDFRNVVMSPPNAIIFRDADLSQCLFQGTRVDKIEFTNVKWAMIPGKLGYSRTGIYDEKISLDSIKSTKKSKKKDKENLDWEHIERVYRDLKVNHIETGDHERAGDFHYGEKEVRRRNPSTPLMHRFFLNLYRILSGYGERYLRPLAWAFFVLISGTIGYLAFGIGMADGLSLGIKDWFTVLLYSLQVMTLLRPTELEPIGVTSTAIKVFQSISGPIILGLFALALRQRLKR